MIILQSRWIFSWRRELTLIAMFVVPINKRLEFKFYTHKLKRCRRRRHWNIENVTTLYAAAEAVGALGCWNGVAKERANP